MNDEFCVMASDGLWDVMSSEIIIKRVHDLLATGTELDDVAEELCELAIRLGSSDNVTLVIIQFINS